jgi:hypothetical protein
MFVTIAAKTGNRTYSTGTFYRGTARLNPACTLIARSLTGGAAPPRGPRSGQSSPMREEMIYRISYDETHALNTDRSSARTEYYPTEQEALQRARELFETADHEGVAIADGDGNVLGGFRLQLKLGYSAE